MRGIKIVCVGKVKETFFTDGIQDSLKKISQRYPVSVMECSDEPTPEKASDAEEKMIREKEGQRILTKLEDEDYVIALCIDGRHYDTEKWQKHMNQITGQVSGSIAFVIGGSLGLSDAVVRRAQEKLSFSAMTFPHQMMRMILCDQIAQWVSS